MSARLQSLAYSEYLVRPSTSIYYFYHALEGNIDETAHPQKMPPPGTSARFARLNDEDRHQLDEIVSAPHLSRDFHVGC